MTGMRPRPLSAKRSRSHARCRQNPGDSARQWASRASGTLTQGKPQQTRELLAAVYGWLAEGFDALDLNEAKALLDELQDLKPSRNWDALF